MPRRAGEYPEIRRFDFSRHIGGCMRPYLDDLSPGELSILARIRLAVTARLVALAAPLDPELTALSIKPFRLTLRVPGLPDARVAGLGGGRVEASAGGQEPAFRGLADMTLRFPSARGCARVLDGANGSVLPLPGGLGAVRALRYFRAAASKAPKILRAPETEAALRARLLLEIALSALVETANADPYVAPKLAHSPDGLVVLDAGEGVRRALRKRGTTLALEALPAEGPRPDAVLAFRNPQAAVAVLSGKQSAVVALGACDASIRGLLPLVQGLFSVLDRASQYLAVKAEKESDHGR